MSGNEGNCFVMLRSHLPSSKDVSLFNHRNGPAVYSLVNCISKSTLHFSPRSFQFSKGARQRKVRLVPLWNLPMQRIAGWLISGEISLKFTLSLRTHGEWLLRCPDLCSRASVYNITVGMMMRSRLLKVGYHGMEAPSRDLQ